MTKINHKYYLFILHSLLPIIIGGLFYIAFRSKTLIMFNWFKQIGIENVIFNIRDKISFFKYLLPNWIYFSLPDGLWIYSFTSFLLIYWDNKFEYCKYWLLIPFTSSIVVEILQLLKMFPGTFDIIDLFFLTLGFSLSLIIINLKFKKYKKKHTGSNQINRTFLWIATEKQII